MKDAYSFDRDEAGLDVSFQAHEGAYERIFERCGLEAHGVAGRVRDDGRQRVDRLPRAVRLGREHARHVRERRLRGRPRDRARRPARAGASRSASTRPRRSRRRASRTIEALAELLSASTWRRPRRRCPSSKDDGTLVLALVRGDDRLEEAKLPAALGSDFRPATDEEIRAGFGAERRLARPGRVRRARSSPTRRCARASSSPARTAPAGTCAASRPAATSGPVRRHPPAEGGRRVPELRRRARLPDRDRGRPHLQARHALLGAARRDVPGRGRRGEADRDGLLRDRPGPGAWRPRSSSTTTRHGIVWPAAIAPYDVHVLVLGWDDPELVAIGEQVAESLSAEGLDVLLDDRDQRPGEKFADADLIGCPLRVTVGKKTLEDGAVDVRTATSGDESRIARLDDRKTGSRTLMARRRKYSDERVRRHDRAADGGDRADLPRPRREDRTSRPAT